MWKWWCDENAPNRLDAVGHRFYSMLQFKISRHSYPYRFPTQAKQIYSATQISYVSVYMWTYSMNSEFSYIARTTTASFHLSRQTKRAKARKATVNCGDIHKFPQSTCGRWCVIVFVIYFFLLSRACLCCFSVFIRISFVLFVAAVISCI